MHTQLPKIPLTIKLSCRSKELSRHLRPCPSSWQGLDWSGAGYTGPAGPSCRQEFPEFAHALHESPQIPNMRRLHEQVEMIGHQNVGVNPAPTLQLRLSKTFQEKPVIVFYKKYSLAVVPALDDMMRISRNRNAGFPSHGQYLTRNSNKNLTQLTI